MLYGFISTGEKTAMYTLRVMTLRDIFVFGEARSVMVDEYVTNLSTDKQMAAEKAQAWCDRAGIPFKGNADFDLNEIKRQKDEFSAAQREEWERTIREQAEYAAAEEARQINEGVMLVGKFIGMTCDEIIAAGETDYLFWMRSNTEAKGKLGISAKIAEKYLADNNIEPAGYMGEEGDAVEATLTLTHCFWTQGQYPTLKHVCKDTEGRTAVFYSVAKGFKEIEIGQSFKVKGTIKRCEIGYGGVKTTTINRPKLIK